MNYGTCISIRAGEYSLIKHARLETRGPLRGSS